MQGSAPATTLTRMVWPPAKICGPSAGTEAPGCSAGDSTVPNPVIASSICMVTNSCMGLDWAAPGSCAITGRRSTCWPSRVPNELRATSTDCVWPVLRVTDESGATGVPVAGSTNPIWASTGPPGAGVTGPSTTSRAICPEPPPVGGGTPIGPARSNAKYSVGFRAIAQYPKG